MSSDHKHKRLVRNIILPSKLNSISAAIKDLMSLSGSCTKIMLYTEWWMDALCTS